MRAGVPVRSRERAIDVSAGSRVQTSVACIDVAALAAAWIAYISFHGGRVVATSLEPSAAGRLELDGGGLGATSHVSLVPRDSAPLLTLGVRAVSDAAARAQLHTLATAGAALAGACVVCITD